MIDPVQLSRAVKKSDFPISVIEPLLSSMFPPLSIRMPVGWSLSLQFRGSSMYWYARCMSNGVSHTRYICQRDMLTQRDIDRVGEYFQCV